MYQFRPDQFVIHCLLQQTDGAWEAFSMEFGLAAQAESPSEAKAKLERMVQSYLWDALCGEDREFASELLSRQAPLAVRLRYWLADVADRLGKKSETYRQPVPMAPVPCH